MPDLDTKIVALSRDKFLLISVLCLGFAVLGFLLFTLDDTTVQGGQLFRSPSIVMT